MVKVLVVHLLSIGNDQQAPAVGRPRDLSFKNPHFHVMPDPISQRVEPEHVFVGRDVEHRRFTTLVVDHLVVDDGERLAAVGDAHFASPFEEEQRLSLEDDVPAVE